MPMRSSSFVFLLLVTLATLPALGDARHPVFQALIDAGVFAEGFERVEMPNGIDFNAIRMVALGEGKSAPAIHFNAEGPFAIPPDVTLEDLLSQQIHNLDANVALNRDYHPEDEVIPGLGASIVDVNGTPVGFMDYQATFGKMARFQRALILVEGRLYGFTLVLFDPALDEREFMRLAAMVIAAVNSGAL